ncbi:MAG: glycosyltransferase family 2 protein [Akkermansia sp.]|nr:glycosyltransferase family 2 protein [Akkermansia sp.]
MNEHADTGMLPISMVMTCYNVEKYIKEAILSCLQQDYTGPMQLVIVDDASTDGTAAVIDQTLAEYAQGWDVTVLHHDKNKGVAASTDTGWAAAKHPWIVMVDGDDIQYPDRCTKTARIAAEHPDLLMIVMCAQKFSDENPDLGILPYCVENYREEIPQLHKLDSAADRAKNYLHRGCNPRLNGFGCSMAFSRALYEKWGNLCRDWEDDGHYAQDPAWEVRAYLTGSVCGSREVACKYRIHETNIFSRKESYDYQGILAQERAKVKYAAFRELTNIHMLEDVDRARHEGFTDWSDEDIRGLESFLMRKLHGTQVRANWWSASLPEKIHRIRIHKSKADFLVRDWAVPRLLPLHVFAAWRWWRERGKRK